MPEREPVAGWPEGGGFLPTRAPAGRVVHYVQQREPLPLAVDASEYDTLVHRELVSNRQDARGPLGVLGLLRIGEAARTYCGEVMPWLPEGRAGARRECARCLRVLGIEAPEAPRTPDALRAEARQRHEAGGIPVEEFVGWDDAADWLERGRCEGDDG